MAGESYRGIFFIERAVGVQRVNRLYNMPAKNISHVVGYFLSIYKNTYIVLYVTHTLFLKVRTFNQFLF